MSEVTGLSFLPLMLIILTSLMLPTFRVERRWIGWIANIGFYVIIARYLWWRITETLLPGGTDTFGTVLIWLVFAVELMAWVETLILSLILVRRTDRHAEADAHERRYKTLKSDKFPEVDVFIATYNEPLDVLEKTIAGALAIDWPTTKLGICILDDGRRDWLKAYCAERNVTYLTRSDNKHAKAGNINAAIRARIAPYFLVLDADFVPQRNILRRAMGFFQDPKIGIVQMPHHFFNQDPMQVNLTMAADLPGEQRFFFDAIQPGRDGWNCAFCCGSNGIIRRAALDEIGGQMPTGSITEDMLLTLALLRKGYVTRYLNECLAKGLAPENLNAYFLQRIRWAQGAIQIFHLRDGPLGPGLSIIQRILFLPTHWISRSLSQPVAMMLPAFFLLTGIPPLIGATAAEVISFQVPVVVSAMILVGFFARESFMPLSATVESVIQSFRIFPTVALTLFKPHGHTFKVTPKGSDAGAALSDTFTIRVALGIAMATGIGLLLNVNPSTRIIQQVDVFPIIIGWSVVNLIILLIVAATCVQRPVARSEERFLIKEDCLIFRDTRVVKSRTKDVSLSGCMIEIVGSESAFCDDFDLGEWVGIKIPEVGVVPGVVRRQIRKGSTSLDVGIAFYLPSGNLRDSLIAHIFSSESKTFNPNVPGIGATLLMLSKIFSEVPPLKIHLPYQEPGMPPDWLMNDERHGSVDCAERIGH